MKTRQFINQIPLFAILIITALMFLIPFYILARNALMTQREIAQFDWQFWAKIPNWENINNLMNDPIANMRVGLRNSAIISLFQV